MMRIDTDDTHAGWEAQEGMRNDECGIRNAEFGMQNLNLKS